MISFKGNGHYQITAAGKTLTITRKELQQLYKEAGKHLMKPEPPKKYHSSSKIKKLFMELHKPDTPKTTTFRLVASKLGISFSAVRKAYYKKN